SRSRPYDPRERPRFVRVALGVRVRDVNFVRAAGRSERLYSDHAAPHFLRSAGVKVQPGSREARAIAVTPDTESAASMSKRESPTRNIGTPGYRRRYSARCSRLVPSLDPRTSSNQNRRPSRSRIRSAISLSAPVAIASVQRSRSSVLNSFGTSGNGWALTYASTTLRWWNVRAVLARRSAGASGYSWES